jgi:hypothetical protein
LCFLLLFVVVVVVFGAIVFGLDLWYNCIIK